MTEPLDTAQEAIDLANGAIDRGVAWKERAQTLGARVAELEAALRFYADPDNYKFGVVEEIKPGAEARKALSDDSNGGS